MTRYFENPRQAGYFLAGRICLAMALLFALTLPQTSCSVRGAVQEHPVEISFANFGTVLCFTWPIGLLIARLSARARASLVIIVLECVLSVVAWAELTFEVVAAAVVSLGGIHAASGYDLASDSLAGYFVLSLFEGTIVVLERRSSNAAKQTSSA